MRVSSWGHLLSAPSGSTPRLAHPFSLGVNDRSGGVGRPTEKEWLSGWKDIVVLPAERLSNHFLLSSTIKLPPLRLHNPSTTIHYEQIVNHRVDGPRCLITTLAFPLCCYNIDVQEVWAAKQDIKACFPLENSPHLSVAHSVWVATPLPSHLHLKSVWGTCSARPC